MRIIMLLAVVALAACDKGDAKAAPDRTEAAGAPAVLAEWREAGLEVGEFATTDGEKYGGGSCQAGQVNGVDAVLCTYASAEAATAAQPAGLETIGAATGSALVTGSLMLVVVDRRTADPEGKAINQATKIFRGR